MSINVSGYQLSKHLTLEVRVTGLRGFHLRWWIARHLMLLAARVAGCSIEIETRRRLESE